MSGPVEIRYMLMLEQISGASKSYVFMGIIDVGLRYVGGRWVWLEFDSMDQVESVKTSKAFNREFLELKKFSHDFIQMKDVFDSWWVCHWHHGLQRFIRSWVVGGEAACLRIWMQRSRLDERLENKEHLDVDSCDSDSPKNVNNDSVSPSSRVLREEDVRRVESDLVDSFEEGEIRDDSVLILEFISGDCGNVTTDDNEDVTQVIAPEKDSIIAPPSTPPGNDLNIVVESGSSWIDYIGPLTSDEIDSDKRWSYRDPNGNIHGLFSLAQLRSWKDYFPSDLQIWSYYGNVKEAILLHNALSMIKPKNL
ncbi:zinc finger CCCH domain-containing protein 19 [Tanacetum coccineum]